MNYVYLFWVKVIGDKQAGKTSEFLSTAIDILKEIRHRNTNIGGNQVQLLGADMLRKF